MFTADNFYFQYLMRFGQDLWLNSGSKLKHVEQFEFPKQMRAFIMTFNKIYFLSCPRCLPVNVRRPCGCSPRAPAQAAR